MSEEKEFGLVNDGINGVKKIPVELKDHSKDPVIKEPEKAIVTPIVEKKKRGRPSKTNVVREFYCSTCRDKHTDLTVMKMGAGSNRYAAFCPNCQKFLNYVDDVMQDTVKKWIKNNPTK